MGPLAAVYQAVGHHERLEANQQDSALAHVFAGKFKGPKMGMKRCFAVSDYLQISGVVCYWGELVPANADAMIVRCCSRLQILGFAVGLTCLFFGVILPPTICY